MGAFPSGQRGQTVNLLSTTSVVRIHPLPPKNGDPVRGCRFLLCSGGWIRKPALGGAPVARRNRRGFSAEKRIHPLSNPQQSEHVPVAHVPRRPGGCAAGGAAGQGQRPPYRQVRRFCLAGAGNARPQPEAAVVESPASGPGTVQACPWIFPGNTRTYVLVRLL